MSLIFTFFLGTLKYLSGRINGMKCRDCGQEILQAHPEICPYCKSKNLVSDEDAIGAADKSAKGGRFEEAALSYEKLDLWDNAKECRLLAKKRNVDLGALATAKIGSITLVCPHCGEVQVAERKLEKQNCVRCGITYLIPEFVHTCLIDAGK